MGHFKAHNVRGFRYHSASVQALNVSGNTIQVRVVISGKEVCGGVTLYDRSIVYSPELLELFRQLEENPKLKSHVVKEVNDIARINYRKWKGR